MLQAINFLIKKKTQARSIMYKIKTFYAVANKRFKDTCKTGRFAYLQNLNVPKKQLL